MGTALPRGRGVLSAPARVRLLAFAWIAAGLLPAAGCGGREAGAPTAPGTGRRYELRAAEPARLVGALHSGLPERIGVVVGRVAGAEIPIEGVEVQFRVLEGGGRVLGQVSFSDARGEAWVPYAPSAEPGVTRVQAAIADDPAAWREIAVLARPALRLSAAPGDVLALPGASEGLLLHVPAGETYDLVPYITSAASGGVEYEILQGAGVQIGAAAPSGAAPALQPARAAGATEPDPAPSRDGFPGIPSELPAGIDVFNCRLSEHRWAPLAATGRHIAVYVDAPEPPDAARLSELVRAFDEVIAPIVIRLFGAPLDLDGNGRLLAVMSAAMPTGTGVYCHTIHTLGREVVFTGWDPSAPLDGLLGLVAHEFQHVINASRHFLAGNGTASDAIWLNEGFSQVAEWKAGYPGADLNRTLGFLGRVNGPLALLGTRQDTGFYAGWFLFALYLGDRFGDGVYADLGRTGLTGRDNVERATGLPFRDLLRDWFVSLAFSGAPSRESAWGFRSIRLDGEAERAATCACLPGDRLPGIAFEELPDDLEFRILRTLGAQDADFFRYTAGDAPGTLYFQAKGDPDVELFALRRR